jgi:hypothetical protein
LGSEGHRSHADVGNIDGALAKSFVLQCISPVGVDLGGSRPCDENESIDLWSKGGGSGHGVNPLPSTRDDRYLAFESTQRSPPVSLGETRRFDGAARLLALDAWPVKQKEVG